MMAYLTGVRLRRSARLGLAGAAILGGVQCAAADDAGLHNFFSAIFGGSAAQSPALPPQGREQGGSAAAGSVRAYRSRPLTVRLRAERPKVILAQGPSKPAKVSIFEDRTLQRGDAVMTPHGVRIFAGSNSWPYTTADFVSIDDAKHLNKGTMSVFAALDRLPRG